MRIWAGQKLRPPEKHTDVLQTSRPVQQIFLMCRSPPCSPSKRAKRHGSSREVCFGIQYLFLSEEAAQDCVDTSHKKSIVMCSTPGRGARSPESESHPGFHWSSRTGAGIAAGCLCQASSGHISSSEDVKQFVTKRIHPQRPV